jgi:ABC-2 type transport system permease protein
MNNPSSPVWAGRLGRLYWVGFTTFVIRSYEDIVRYFFMTIAPSVVTTWLYFVVFGMLIGSRVGSVGGVPYREYIAPGIIAMPVITSSFSHASLSFLAAKLHRLIDEHLISPLPSWMIVVSYVAGGVLRGALVGVSVGVVVVPFADAPVGHLVAMIGALLLTSLVASLAGFLNGVYARTFDQASLVPSFVLTPLTYLNGVFYSVSLLPPWARVVSRANPIFYAVNLFRYGMLGVADVRAGTAVSVLLVGAVAMFGVASRLIGRGKGIRE